MNGISKNRGGDPVMPLIRFAHSLIPSLMIVIILFLFLPPPALAENSENFVLITYFHTTARCPTCHKIESYSKESIEKFFKNELEAGKVVFRTLNIDKSENKPYIKKYNLFTKSLIVSLKKNGREDLWKNLPEIWKLVRDRDKFEKYVLQEVTAYLERL